MDEASTISYQPVLIISLRNEDGDLSPIIFFDLFELEVQGAEQIYASLLKSLNDGGFDNEYLKKKMIAFRSDGESVMLSHNSWGRD